MTSASTGSQVVKATFHYSNQLQTWLQTWFSARFAARFSTCFRHAFDTLSTFSSKTWLRTCCINLDMLRLMQQVRWWCACYINGIQNSPSSILKLLHVSRYQLISLAFISGSIVLRIISVSAVSDILFNPCGVFPFLRLGRYHCGTLTARHDCSTCNDYFVFVIHFAKNRSDI